jgi:hypothetical protein
LKKSNLGDGPPTVDYFLALNLFFDRIKLILSRITEKVFEFEKLFLRKQLQFTSSNWSAHFSNLHRQNSFKKLSKSGSMYSARGRK